MTQGKVNIELALGGAEPPQALSHFFDDDTTFEDLLEIVSVEKQADLADFCFFAGGRYLPLRSRVRGAPPAVRLLRPPLTVRVTHRGASAEVPLARSATPPELRALFAEQTGAAQSEFALDFAGERLADEAAAEDNGVFAAALAAPVELTGALRLTVRDRKAALAAEVEAQLGDTAEALARRFCAKEGRLFRAGSALFCGGRELDPSARLFDAEPRPRDGDELRFEAAPFEVSVVDRDAERQFDAETQRLTAEEHWDVARLRDEFAASAGRTLSDSDRLFFGEAPLDPSTPLARLRLEAGAELALRSTAFEPACAYACADCGKELLLKASDAVKCQVCYYPIVYKKRTERMCHYNCR